MKTLLLIDANALIHRAFHALPPLTSPAGEPTQALYGVASILMRVWREGQPDYVAAFFDRPEPTFRKAEYEKYKATRPPAAHELVKQIIAGRDLFREFGVPVFEAPGFEADDLIATCVKRFEKERDLRIVILTGDLDALQLVRGDKVVVRTLKTGVSDTQIYNETAVKARYGLLPAALADYKALAGDHSDNIPGLPGVGPKTASTLLQKYGSVENLYAHLTDEPKFKEKYGALRDDALLFKKLATAHTDAPLELSRLADLRSAPLGETVQAYLTALGFESLVKRLNGESTRREQPQKTVGAPPAPPAGLFGNISSVAAPQNKGELLIIRDAAFGLISSHELNSTKTKVGFRLKQAIKEARQQKLSVCGPYFDLGIGFWLLDPDFRKYDPQPIFAKFFGRDWSGSDQDYMAAWTFLKSGLEAAGSARVFYEIEMPLLEVLSDMELYGIAVDRVALGRLSADMEREVLRLKSEIKKAAGHEVNVNSPRQLAKFLFDELKLGGKARRTATGQLSTDVEALTAMKGTHPVVDTLLSYRDVFKLYSTYAEPIGKLTGSDGRLHTDFVQTGAATGRLSSQNPNLQNIPAVGSATGALPSWERRLREVFVAAPGHQFAAFDYSQLELRILAAVSGDQAMRETFVRGEDIHARTAAAILKVPIDKVDPAMRRLAKTLNFGIVYGMGATSFAKTTGMKRDQAKAFIVDYLRAFPGIASWHERIKEAGRQQGYVTNANGRRRLVPGITYGSGRIAAEAERIAINMPIQSLGADIIKLAMIKTHALLAHEPGAKLVLSIHDELLFEVRDDIIVRVAARIKEAMESAYALEVPLVVNAKFGKNLAEMK